MGLAILLMFSNIVYAEEVPYQIDIKYLSKESLELVVQKNEDGIFILKTDIEEAAPKLDFSSLKSTKIGNIEYLKLSDFASYKEYDGAYMIDGELLPKFMPKQIHNFQGVSFTNKPVGESLGYVNYNVNYNPKTKAKNIAGSYTLSNGYDKFGTIAVNYRDKLYLDNVTLRYDNRENNNQWILGTNFNQNSLGNYINYVGLKFQSDFKHNPNYSSDVSSSFTGMLNNEAIATLLLDDVPLKNFNLKPGEFEFLNLHNSLTSDGSATLKLKEKDGTEKVITQKFLGAPLNLGAGKYKYGFDFGLNKNNETGKYQDLTLSGNYSYGLTDKVTLLSDFTYNKIGHSLNLSSNISMFGTAFSPTYSVGSTGSAYGLGILKTSKTSMFNFSAQKYSNYSDGAGFKNYSGYTLMATGGTRIFDLPVQANIVSQNGKLGYGVSTSFPIGEKVKLNLSADKRPSGEMFYGLTLSFSLDGKSQSVKYSSRDDSLSTGYSNSSNLLDTLNYNTSVVKYPDRSELNADINYNTQYGNYGMFINADSTTKEINSNFSASGSMIYKDGNLNFGRPITDSVAYFKTDYKDVVFKSFSGYQGKTSDNGVLYIPINGFSDFTFIIDDEKTDEMLLPERTEFNGTTYPYSARVFKPKIRNINEDN